MENVTSLSSSLSKQKDYINCPATLATCSTLNPSHKLDTLLADDVNEAVFQVNLAHIMVPSKDAKLTREDHRLFTRLMVADASGAIMVDAGSKVMLNLAGLQEGETTSICDSPPLVSLRAVVQRQQPNADGDASATEQSQTISPSSTNVIIVEVNINEDNGLEIPK